jgi:hypothetical protein
VSRPTRGPIDGLPVRGCHPLWPAFPDGSGSDRSATGLVRVRSPLLTESRLMSFPPGTEMFQFPGFASAAYGFSGGSSRRRGLPHSEIPGSKPARGSPGLVAACHVLHRLLAPRHPPDALAFLDPHQRQPHPEGPGRRPCGRSSNNLQKAYPCFLDARPRRKGRRACVHACQRPLAHDASTPEDRPRCPRTGCHHHFTM